MKRLLIPIPLSGGMDPSTRYGASLSMSMDENYVLTISLLDQNNEILSTQSVDTPLESVVIGGSYDAQTESLILVLQNGNEITIPVSGLIANMRSTYDLADMTQAELVDFYTNYATLITQNTYVVEGYPFTTTTVVHPQYGTILVLEYQLVIMDETGGAAEHTANVTLKTAWILADGTLTLNTVSQTIPTTAYLSTVAHTGSYNDLTDKPASGQSFYMSQEEFDALVDSEWEDPVDGGDYFIQGPVQYDEIEGTPNMNIYATKNITEKKLAELEAAQKGYEIVYLTQQEYDNLPNKLEGVMYIITGNTITMEVTFQDQSTATYNVVVD